MAITLSGYSISRLKGFSSFFSYAWFIFLRISGTPETLRKASKFLEKEFNNKTVLLNANAKGKEDVEQKYYIRTLSNHKI